MEHYIKTVQSGHLRGLRGIKCLNLLCSDFYPSVVAKTNFLDGYRNPSWKSQVAAHIDAGTDLVAEYHWTSNNPVSVALWKCVDSGIFIRVYKYSVNEFLQLSHFDVPTIFPSSVSGLASSRFYSKVYDILSPVKGGIIIGELAKTLHMLRHPLDAMDKFLRHWGKHAKKAVKPWHRKYPNSGSAVHLASDLYKEFVFGWNPLRSDVQDILDRVSGKTGASLLDYYVDVRGYASSIDGSATGPSVDSASWGPAPHYDLWQVTSVTRLEYNCRYRGVVKIKMGPEGFSIPQDFLPTIYELIPFSFLLDYVSNLGQMVQAISIPRCKIAWYVRTDRTEKTVRMQAIPRLPPPIYTSRFVEGAINQSTAKSHRIQRTHGAGSQLPLPTFSLKMPTLVQTLKALTVTLGLVKS